MRKVVLAMVAIGLVLALHYVARRGAVLGKLFGPSRTPTDGRLANPVPAASFSILGIDGRPLELSSYRGKVVLLDFWATWCDPCRDEIPHFVDLQNKYRGQGLQNVGISMDDGPKPVREFYQKYAMNYPVAMGTAKLAEAYGGILGIPVTFLIDRQGRIAAKYVGQADMSVVEGEIRSLLEAR